MMLISENYLRPYIVGLAFERKILSALPEQEQNQLLAILDKLEAAELALKP